MEIEQWPIERLRPYARNPRKNDEAVPRMVEVLREFGFRAPMLARSDGKLIDGHLRLKAARAMNMVTVPVIVADDMTPEQELAFRILINRSATWADWDEDLLLQELRALQAADFNLSYTGFDQQELDDMLMRMDDSKRDPDKVPAEPEAPVVRDGEIWILGRHRVMCGDARSLADARRLLAGGEADMIWTDPPYNVNYSGKAGKIKNDKMSPEQFAGFLASAHSVMHETLRPGGGIYVAHAEAGDSTLFRDVFTAAGFRLSACLIWRKQTAVLGRGDYQFAHEPILYGWRRGAAHRWYGNRKQRSVLEFDQTGMRDMGDGSFEFVLDGRLYHLTGEALCVEEVPTTVIDVSRPARSALHPTTKPVALIERMVANSSPQGGVVADYFGGSGSTLMACERLGRSARLMEVDPKFAQVILERWQEYSGVEATRESDGRTLAEIKGAVM
ncbi:MAG: DNA modification methylase [Desulfovibrio sp.]|jgi:DNA modification methylase|nr:DNA modification methylase [Desulfovibrio sp.]